MPMRQLLLLRHAKSSWDAKGVSDQDRPLSPRGRRAVALMRGAMLDLGLAPDIVLVSPARRTRETLEALQPWDEAPLIEPTAKLYLATAPQLLEVLREMPETARSVLLIVHNPGLHDLSLRLVGGRDAPARTPASDRARTRLAEGYPTGALAEFGIAGSWAQLDTGSGQLIRFLRPRDLPQDGSGAPEA